MDEDCPCYECLCIPICQNKKTFRRIYLECSLIKEHIEPSKFTDIYRERRDRIVRILNLPKEHYL